jgi:hypothetical protein
VRFERWRQTRSQGERIPESLWTAAVKLAETHGVARISTALRIDYYALKKRLGPVSPRASSRPEGSVATFVELASPVRVDSRECTVELENAAGAKMRIHVRGGELPDLAALSRSFWES